MEAIQPPTQNTKTSADAFFASRHCRRKETLSVDDNQLQCANDMIFWMHAKTKPAETERARIVFSKTWTLQHK